MFSRNLKRRSTNSFGRPRPLSRMSRSARMDTQNCTQDAGFNRSLGKLFGTISTREKFLDQRLELAIHGWARMKAYDSLECRNCHSAQSKDTTDRVHGLSRPTSVFCSLVKRLVSIATKASRIISPICAMFLAGSRPARKYQWLALPSSHFLSSGVLLPRATAIPSLTRTGPPSV